MASSAGFQLAAGRIPGELITSSVATADSANFTTTEVIVMTITAPLVTGRTYSIWAGPTFHSTVDGDVIHSQMREDDVLGTILDRTDDLSNVAPTALDRTILFCLYTATATANKTFVITGDRVGGTGSCRLEAAADRPAYMLVRYETG